jgi:ATP-binding cassette subfamily B protein
MLVADVAAALIVAACSLALPLSANFVTSAIAGQGPEAALPLIGITTLVMLGVLALQLVAEFFVDYQGHLMGARIEGGLRQRLFEHCLRLSFSFYDRERTGQLMSRITNDTFWLGELFHHGPEDAMIAVLKFLGAMAVLLWIDPVLAGVIAALVPPAVLYALHFNRRMNIALTESKARVGEINARLEDSLAGIRVVQSFGNEADELRRFSAANADFVRSRGDGYRSEAWFSVGMEAFSQIVVITVIGLGSLRLATGNLTLAQMLTFLLTVGILVDPVRRLANFVRLWQEGYTGFVRTMALLDETVEVAEKPGATALPAVRGEIRFERVSFAYEGTPPVLHDLDLAIAPGEFVALVGASGVGKSTLCALVPRFYDVTAGAVLIDGHDIRDVTLASLRNQIGVVQQDVYLFAGTVRENLRYGRPGATDAEVEAAARAANAHEFIMALPQGYDTDIGQRGVKLSGGQKQRLTIARTILKDPAILIFDEATSALDVESERVVQKALLHLASGRTTLVIAHRLSTVRHADRILVLGPDGIIEEGTHDALMKAGGAYCALHELQGHF